jgi:hypothetical protein
MCTISYVEYIATSTYAALTTLLRERGIGSLYSGLIPAVGGAVPSSGVLSVLRVSAINNPDLFTAIYFGTYELVKRSLQRLTDYMQTKTTEISPNYPFQWRVCVHMLSAASGNVMSSLFFVPKEVLKQKLQVKRSFEAYVIHCTFLQALGSGAVLGGDGRHGFRAFNSILQKTLNTEAMQKTTL